MTDWADGYVSDVEYLSGFYTHQEAGLMSLACLINGFQPPDMEGGYSYCDLGCGFGETLLVLAAANPQSEFRGVDFNPAHVARAEAMGRKAGLTNVSFHEVGFDALARGEGAKLPRFDFLAAHGVYSWISEANRRALLAVLERYAKPGAAVYISYNSLPSSTPVIPVQWLLREYAALVPGRSDQRFLAAVGLLDKLSESGAHFLKDSKPFKDLKRMPESQAAHYGSHEYLNDSWQPSFFADVARAAAGSKLHFAGSAQITHAFKEFLFRPEQIALLEELPDPLIRETVKDFFQPLGLRRDVFVRGAQRLTETKRHQLLEQVRLTLKVERSRARFEIPIPLGKATLSEDTYVPVFDALAEGPKTLAELFALPALRRAKKLSPVEVAGMLVGSDQASPSFHAMEEAAVASAQRYNVNLAREVLHGSLNEVRALAAPVSGGGLLMTSIEPLVYLALAEGCEESMPPLRDFVWSWFRRMNEKPMKDGKAIKSKAAATRHIGELVEELLKHRVPLWRQLKTL